MTYVIGIEEEVLGDGYDVMFVCCMHVFSLL